MVILEVDLAMEFLAMEVLAMEVLAVGIKAETDVFV